MPLKKKKANTQKDWVQAYKNAIFEQDKERSERLVKKAISRLPQNRDNCIFGWSGGKDALALEVICKEAGIKKCCLNTINLKFEFPDFLDYIETNAPEGLVINDFKYDEKFMIDHPQYVFPDNSREAYFWYRHVNMEGCYQYAEKCNAKHIIVGHRNMDGNRCIEKHGKIYPMFDFSHEDVFCILACNNVVLPPIYFYPNGFYHGSGCWIKRFGGKHAMDDIYMIDKSILVNHRYIPKIDEYLREKGE